MISDLAIPGFLKEMNKNSSEFPFEKFWSWSIKNQNLKKNEIQAPPSGILFCAQEVNTVRLIVNFTAKEDDSLNQSIRIWAFIVLIYNLILTLCLTISCNSNLKTQNALSHKTNALNIMEFFAKLLIPFFIYSDDLSISKAGKVILIIVITLYCICRDSMFLRILPFYRLNTLNPFPWWKATFLRVWKWTLFLGR